jgi:hypothetical protein
MTVEREAGGNPEGNQAGSADLTYYPYFFLTIAAAYTIMFSTSTNTGNKIMAIVTRESLTEMIEQANDAKRQAIVGRALVVIFNNQTDSEKVVNDTKEDNGVGFTGADARAGSLTAKFWLKHQRLEDWMMDNWTRKNVRGVMRLAKYHKQLDAAAQAKK